MNKIYLVILMSLSMLTMSAQQKVIEDILTDMGKEYMVIIRQDYQLVDDDDNIKNVEGKDYWDRTYSLALRVGDDMYMVSEEAVRPWGKSALSKKDKFQPAVSSSAYKPLDGLEFDEIDYDESPLTEILENRIYTLPGSEVPGASVITPKGNREVFLVVADNENQISKHNESAGFKIVVVPTNFNFVDNKNIYEMNVHLPNTAFGGFAVAPVVLRPGLVDFCVVGMLQKVSGIWKLIAVPEGTVFHQSENSVDYDLEAFVGGLVNSIDTEMNAALNVLGIPK